MGGSTYSVDKFIADETTTHFRADQLESACQIIRRFVVIILQLMKDLKDEQELRIND